MNYFEKSTVGAISEPSAAANGSFLGNVSLFRIILFKKPLI